MSQAEWTPQAETDLEEIVYYIAVQDGRPQTAAKNAHEIRDKCEHYAKHTEIGTKRDDLALGLYCFRHKRWLIFYEPLETGIRVLHVVDGSRDYPRLFR